MLNSVLYINIQMIKIIADLLGLEPTTFTLLKYKDSNLELQNQNLSCYQLHHTSIGGPAWARTKDLPVMSGLL